MEKIAVEYLSIEITRRCNMKCAHCLCGDAQNIDIDLEHIRSLIRRVSSIESLCFTGGEPSLNVPAIKFTLEQIKRRRIKVNRFNIVTNGSLSSINKEFIAVCQKLCDYQAACGEEDDICEEILYLSNDRYHDDTHHYEVNKELSKLSFYSRRFSENVPYRLIRQGRCKEGIDLPDTVFCYRKSEITGTVFLNANGYILGNCNYSYENQEKHQLCHVDGFMEYLRKNEIKTLY